MKQIKGYLAKSPRFRTPAKASFRDADRTRNPDRKRRSIDRQQERRLKYSGV